MAGRSITVCLWLTGRDLCRLARPPEVLKDHLGEVVDLGEVAAMPGLINAHCHLDYTLMRGATLPGKNFSRWVKRINALKRSLTDNDYLRATQLGFAELRRIWDHNRSEYCFHSANLSTPFPASNPDLVLSGADRRSAQTLDRTACVWIVAVSFRKRRPARRIWTKPACPLYRVRENV